MPELKVRRGTPELRLILASFSLSLSLWMSNPVFNRPLLAAEEEEEEEEARPPILDTQGLPRALP